MLADFQGSGKRPVFCLCLNSSCLIQFLVCNRPIISVCGINKVHCWLKRLGQGNGQRTWADLEILTPGFWRLGKRLRQQLLRPLYVQGATKTQCTNRPWWQARPMQVWLKFRPILVGGGGLLIKQRNLGLGPYSGLVSRAASGAWSMILPTKSLSDGSWDSRDLAYQAWSPRLSGQRPNS